MAPLLSKSGFGRLRRAPKPSFRFQRFRYGAYLSIPTFIWVTVAAMLAGGCGDTNRLGGAAAGKTVVIRFWNGFTGPDGRTMLKMVRRFNQENPDVRVLMQRMAWGTYYNKLFVAGLGGRAPEVFVVHTDVIPRFQQTDVLRAVDDLVKGANGIDAADLAPNVWKAVEKDGQHYALPLDCHPLGLYYNKRLFREAGIVDERGEARPPRTRTEFLDAARRLTRDSNGDGRPDQWGFVFTWFRTNCYAVMRQFGGEFLSKDGTRCIMDNARNVEALQFCVDLIRKHKVAPNPEGFDSWIGFRQGRVGMALEGVYMLEDLKKQADLEYGGTAIPLFGEENATWAGSHNLCLRSGMDARHEEAAWRFVKFLSDNSLDWAEGGQVPIRKSLLDTDRFRSMPVQSAFAQEIPYIHYLPCVTFSFEFGSEIDAAVEKALRGSASPQAALQAAARQVDKVIARQRDMAERAQERLQKSGAKHD